MRAYGEIEVARTGLIAVSLESKKLRLSPPVPTRGEALRSRNNIPTE